MRLDKAAIQTLRFTASPDVGRRILSSKKDRISRRPSANGSFQPWGIRIPPSPRAGQTTTDTDPRNSRFKKLFFHRRLETSDNRRVDFAQSPRKIVGLENHVARASHGAEESNQHFIEYPEIALQCHRRRAFGLSTTPQHCRAIRCIGFVACGLHLEFYSIALWIKALYCMFCSIVSHILLARQYIFWDSSFGGFPPGWLLIQRPSGILYPLEK